MKLPKGGENSMQVRNVSKGRISQEKCDLDSGSRIAVAGEDLSCQVKGELQTGESTGVRKW